MSIFLCSIPCRRKTMGHSHGCRRKTSVVGMYLPSRNVIVKVAENQPITNTILNDKNYCMQHLCVVDWLFAHCPSLSTLKLIKINVKYVGENGPTSCNLYKSELLNCLKKEYLDNRVCQNACMCQTEGSCQL